MGLLRSVDNKPGIDFLEYRESKYYGKYTYKAKFKLIGAHHAKSLYKFRNNKPFLDKRLREYYSYDRAWLIQVQSELPRILAFGKWQEKNSGSNITMRSETSNISIFSDDLALLHTLKATMPTVNISFIEIVLYDSVGVKYFTREPKHKYRVYLKSKRVEIDFVESLYKTLKKNEVDMVPCPALRTWINERLDYSVNRYKYMWTSASHFIDYDQESMLSYLGLMHGDMLSKKYELKKRPHPV